MYDATTGALVCVSCDPGGARPVGPAHLGGDENPYPALEERLGGGTTSTFYEPHNFSEDGSRLFFQSPDALVPQDSNGRDNVYEYEDGHIYPISDVAGNFDSYFLDASPSGNDVFIDTADQLLPSDTDFRDDVYDVRVDGGYPVSVSRSPCDNADSCKAPVSPQPGVFGPPPSATFTGAGNVVKVQTGSAPVVESKPRSLTRAQKLTAALRACRKRPRKRRAGCESQARKHYGAKSA